MKWIQCLVNKNDYIFYGFIFYCLFTAIPAFSENPKKLGLATLKMNSSGEYGVMALSADGNVAVGWAKNKSDDYYKAVRWSADNYWQMTYVDTLKTNNVGESYINALSADGKTAGGVSYSNDSRRRAVISRADDNWLMKDLGTLRSNNSGYSELTALSADGKIAGGWAHNSINYHAVIWYSDNHWQIKDLGTLRWDNSGYSELTALSADGKIAVGWADNHSGDRHAVMWFSDNNNHWRIKDVGTLKSNNSGLSDLTALSADGKIVAGWAVNDSDNRRAVILTADDDYSRMKDLGTLKSDNSGKSKIEALSSDGKIAVGWAYNDGGKKRRVIWYGDDWQIKKDVGPLENYYEYDDIEKLAAARTLAIEFSNTDSEIPKLNAISQIPESIPETPAENVENLDPPQDPNNNVSKSPSSVNVTDTIDASLVDGVESNHERQEQTSESVPLKPEQPQPLEMKIQQLESERDDLKTENDNLKSKIEELKKLINSIKLLMSNSDVR